MNLANAKIAQLLIPIEDFEQGVAFYRDVLGLRFLFAAPPQMAFFECGGVRLLVGVMPPGQRAQRGSAIYFQVPDIRAVYSSLAAKGVNFGAQPHVVNRTPTSELWLAEFTDPDGNQLALMSEVESGRSDGTSRTRIVVLTSLAMLAFACNSLLCRLALKHTVVDAASFTTIRLTSGAIMLWLVARLHRGRRNGNGNWPSALALFAYAAGFSLAYVSLPASMGALLLFGAVQATMIGYGLWTGERFRGAQVFGLVLALAGLVGLLLPGLSAPPLLGSVLMLGAGVAWGVYSLRGKGAADPTRVTAGNFLRAVPVAAALSLLTHAAFSVDRAGIAYAVASGALASGIGYAIWYTVLPALKATSAATVQLSVPVLAAVGGIVFLGESVSLRLVLASVAILGGIALVILEKQNPAG